MERSLGRDVHAQSVTFSVLDESGRQIPRDVGETHGKALVGYLQQLSERLHLRVEEGEWSQWLHEVSCGPAAYGVCMPALGVRSGAQVGTKPSTAGRTMAARAGSARALRLRISLREIAPEVWREVLVPESSSLAKLHAVFQRAMGWTNSHLYEFEINGQRFTDLETWEPFDDDEEPGDTRVVRLRDLELEEHASFTYLYDFGDDWLHDVVVEEVLPTPKGERLPRCTAGARACPPEDCGGIHGYFDLLEALHDPSHPEHESSRVWVGGRFDPEAFDLRKANSRRG